MAAGDLIALKQNVGGSFDEIATSTVIDGLKVLKQNASGGFDEAITPSTGSIIALKQNAAGNYDESIISLFDGVLYNNGVEGVEWEKGIQSGTASNRLLDKSQNVLHAQVSGSGLVTEASWTTKNAVDVSNYNNLRVIYDYNNPGSARLGVFLGVTKNISANASEDYLSTYFIAYDSSSPYGSGTRTVNIPFNFSGSLYVSVLAVKSQNSNQLSFIKAKEMVLEFIP